MEVHEETAISMVVHPPNVWEQFVDGACFILKCEHSENIFDHIKNLHQNTSFSMKEESNRKLLVFSILYLKKSNETISIMVWREPVHTDQYLHYNFHHQTCCKGSAIFSLYDRRYCIIISNDYLNNKKTRTKQVWKETSWNLVR